MYKLCKTEQSVLRQRELEEGLLQAMLREPYESISVSELCDALGVPRKSFYRYFSGKDGCLQALLDHRIMGYQEGAGKGNPVSFRGFSLDLDYFFYYWLTQQDLLHALHRNGLGGILVERTLFHSQEAKIFADGMHDAEYVRQVTAFVVCGIMSLVLRWYADGYRQTPAEMANMTREILLNPLVLP